jgi:DNA-binding NarL/FixJ family response regulator
MNRNPRTASETGNPARVFIVDDHPVIYEGLARLIGNEPDMTVCGGAEGASAARAKLGESRPDAVVVDLALKEGTGLELIKDLHARYPDLPVLVLSMRDESVFAERALRAGARGYVMKEAAGVSLIGALKTVLKGNIYLSDSLSRRLLTRLSKTAQCRNEIECLTDRELEVFGLLGHGLTTRQIAEKLGRSVKTVESHRENIKRKLGCRNAAELVQRAVRWVQRAEG